MSIEIKNLTHTYAKNTVFEHKALKDINLSVDKTEFIAIVGHTGSGKSSLIQHLNAILLPTSGELIVDGFKITTEDKKTSFKELRKKVGMVFQFSDYQLFEETVLKDVMFGPKNFGMNEEDAEKQARQYLKMVNIPESYYNNSPFELSGGQKRRIAIAGILVMDPDIIVLDEPTAGLDPQGAHEIMEVFLELREKHHKTLILVSHDMNFVYKYADRVILMDKGEIVVDKNKVDFFNLDYLKKYSIEKPSILQVYEKFLNKKADTYISFDLLIDELKKEYSNVK